MTPVNVVLKDKLGGSTIATFEAEDAVALPLIIIWRGHHFRYTLESNGDIHYAKTVVWRLTDEDVMSGNVLKAVRDR